MACSVDENDIAKAIEQGIGDRLWHLARADPIRTLAYLDGCMRGLIMGLPAPGHLSWMKEMDIRFLKTAGNVVDSNVMCSSEVNINISDEVSSTSITNNVVWQRGRSSCYNGCRPDKSNVKAKPLFRAPERGDFRLLSNSPGYKAIGL